MAFAPETSLFKAIRRCSIPCKKLRYAATSGGKDGAGLSGALVTAGPVTGGWVGALVSGGAVSGRQGRGVGDGGCGNGGGRRASQQRCLLPTVGNDSGQRGGQYDNGNNSGR